MTFRTIQLLEFVHLTAFKNTKVTKDHGRSPKI